MVADRSFRPIGETDLSLLQRGVVLARGETATIQPGEAADLTDFGTGDDFGVIAEDPSGAPVGVAWARLPKPGTPGFVAADVPELVIAVFEGQRGRGLGHDLLAELEKAALLRGYRRLALWTEPTNPSRRLYARRGYHPVGQDPQVMEKNL